jgi:hypothetical protein
VDATIYAGWCSSPPPARCSGQARSSWRGVQVAARNGDELLGAVRAASAVSSIQSTLCATTASRGTTGRCTKLVFPQDEAGSGF